MNEEPAIQKALLLFDGSQVALARAAGVSQPAIHKALNAKRVSAEMAIKIETATEGRVSRCDLRPDLWSAPSDLARAAS